MSTGTKGLLILLAGSAVGAILFSLWRVNREPAQVRVASTPTGEGREDSAPAELAPVLTIREPAPEPAPVVEQASDTALAAPAERPEASESWRAIHEMLADREFLDACARPTEIASEKLKALVAKAEDACSREVQEVAQARLEAGLFDRIPGYVPGQEVKWPSDKASTKLFRSWVGNETGEAGWVVLERVDHPELYELSDRKEALAKELKARERAAR